ncbi:hypothetical protein PENDEC_c010G01764 [Penicillium decumbens]|uniref:Uncharacterized protein n=1 Tax=Penicillium decumbens TaxID=69771 RepID=A0A1V6PC11_PENDC|nr:hypothetical protein PENDEC_c010G01764 [Penicillium decumbens]
MTHSIRTIVRERLPDLNISSRRTTSSAHPKIDFIGNLEQTDFAIFVWVFVEEFSISLDKTSWFSSGRAVGKVQALQASHDNNTAIRRTYHSPAATTVTTH